MLPIVSLRLLSGTPFGNFEFLKGILYSFTTKNLLVVEEAVLNS